MNEDIKRILTTLKEEYENIGLSHYPEDLFNRDDPKIIYDYITYLQQKNQVLKERIEYLERSIARKEETIDDKQNEIVSFATTIEKIKHILNNQIDYREFVDIVNAIEDVLKESDVK